MKTRAVTVVHLLSPSPGASRVFRERLAGLFGWNLVEVTNQHQWHSPWHSMFGGSASSPSWDSIGLQCPLTGTMVHWISVDNSNPGTAASAVARRHCLLGVLMSQTGSLEESRDTLAEATKGTRAKYPMLIRSFLGQSIPVSDFLGREGPILLDCHIPCDCNETKNSTTQQYVLKNTLKEIAVPYFPHSTYSDGTNMVERLGTSQHLDRPAAGLYKFRSGPLLRPLPATPEDRSLSPPSLVFHCDSLALAETSLLNRAGGDLGTVARVGKTGARAGQLVVRHQDWAGLDIRLCEREQPSSMFAEAQESLMAASLPELQSEHVKGSGGKADAKVDCTDCWVEFRANVSNPLGFLHSKNQQTRPKKASIPNLPYE